MKKRLDWRNRPRKPARSRKTRALGIRVDEQMATAISELSECEGVSVGEWLRGVIDEGISRRRPSGLAGRKAK
jgi:hypothetical protein